MEETSKDGKSSITKVWVLPQQRKPKSIFQLLTITRLTLSILIERTRM